MKINDKVLNLINSSYKDIYEKMSEKEKKDLVFDLEMAETVWEKVKGYPIPDCYSVEDRVGILERYWHRAVEKE